MDSLFNSKVCFQLVGTQYVLLHPHEVVCAVADKQLCRIYLTDGNKLIVGHHLGYYKQKLLVEHGFIAVSRSMLVNFAHISKYNPKERTLYLSDGTVVIVSKGRQENLNQLFRKIHDKPVDCVA